MSEKYKLDDFLSKVIFVNGQCLRHDVVIRYMGIENYVKCGELHPLYIKLQEKRIKTMSSNPKAKFNKKRFVDTIESFCKTRKFSPCSPIEISKDYVLIEGSHRIACCMFLDIEDIYVEVIDKKPSRENYKWYEQHFTKAELEDIKLKKQKLINMFIQNG